MFILAVESKSNDVNTPVASSNINDTMFTTTTTAITSTTAVMHFTPSCQQAQIKHTSLAQTDFTPHHSSMEETVSLHPVSKADIGNLAIGKFPAAAVVTAIGNPTDKFPAAAEKPKDEVGDLSEDLSASVEQRSVDAEVCVPSDDVLAASVPTLSTVSEHDTTPESGVDSSQHTTAQPTGFSSDDGLPSSNHSRKPDNSDECCKPKTTAETMHGSAPGHTEHTSPSTDHSSSSTQLRKLEDSAEDSRIPSALNVAMDSSNETVVRSDLLAKEQPDTEQG